MESQSKPERALEDDELWYATIAGGDGPVDGSVVSREARAIRETVLANRNQEPREDMSLEWNALRNRLQSEGLLGSGRDVWWKWTWKWKWPREHGWALGLIVTGIVAVAIVVPYMNNIDIAPEETEVPRGGTSILIRAPDVALETDRIVKLCVEAKVPFQRRSRDDGIELEIDLRRGAPPAIQSLFSEYGVEVRGGQKAFILILPESK